MPAVWPSGVGCTGVAYSIGYNSRCDSTAFRTSSLSLTSTVLIQVIHLSFFAADACDERKAGKPGNPTRRPRRRDTPATGYYHLSGTTKEQSSTETESG